MSSDLTYKEEYDDRIEICTKCDREFKNSEHFIRCDIDNCPMKGESLLDILLGDDDG